MCCKLATGSINGISYILVSCRIIIQLKMFDHVRSIGTVIEPDEALENLAY